MTIPLVRASTPHSKALSLIPLDLPVGKRWGEPTHEGGNIIGFGHKKALYQKGDFDRFLGQFRVGFRTNCRFL